MIRIKGLTKYYHRGKSNELQALKGLDLELPDRGMVAIFGRSGCGKTTLLNLIGGLDRKDGGEIRFGDGAQEISANELHNRCIGYIFQNYNLQSSESCFHNVASALTLCGLTDRREIRERVEAALTNVGMAAYSSRTPDTLSGGQQQRIAIARAIVKNPPIILADEPTGNLDEANTVLIMDLLKQLSEEHLVLLVTHEADLVDHYCDTVIEMADGVIVNVRRNSHASGYSTRDKNHIYLGELERRELRTPEIAMEYYGDVPDEPIRMKLVRHDGKMYLHVDCAGVEVLDGSSEIELREGVFVSETARADAKRRIDMSSLPPISERENARKRYGRLFTLRSMLAGGIFSSVMRSNRRLRRGFRTCLALFAISLVCMSAVFGRAFYYMRSVDEAYNHHVFYVRTPDGETSEKLLRAWGDPDSGIDYVNLSGRYAPSSDRMLKFMTGSFETFATGRYGESYTANAVCLGMSLAEDLPLVVGTREGLLENDILITTAVADTLLAGSTLGYITEYRDLLGMITDSLAVNGKNLRIAGIVRSSETSVYLADMAMARLAFHMVGLKAAPASDYGLSVADGESVLLIRMERVDISYPSAAENILLHGQSFTLSEVLRDLPYDAWLEEYGTPHEPEDVFYRRLILRDHPDCVPDTAEFKALYEEYVDLYYYAYVASYFSQYEAYMKHCALFEQGFYGWLLAEKGLSDAVYLHAANSDYYYASLFHREYGRYPSMTEMRGGIFDQYASMSDLDDQYFALYYDQYMNSERYGMDRYEEHLFLVSDEAYVALSRGLGESHELAMDAGAADDWWQGYETPANYSVVHSADPEKTERFILESFSGLTDSDDLLSPYVTPGMIREELLWESGAVILGSLIGFVSVLAVMSLCMYFIMRSVLMKRIREIGIYRAIGVSKGNLLFRFLAETAFFALPPVLLGFFLSSGVIFGLASSALPSEGLYYPPWLALCTLVFLCATCLFYGVFPILGLLLRRTPSEILAKYDI